MIPNLGFPFFTFYGILREPAELGLGSQLPLNLCMLEHTQPQMVAIMATSKRARPYILQLYARGNQGGNQTDPETKYVQQSNVYS